MQRNIYHYFLFNDSWYFVNFYSRSSTPKSTEDEAAANLSEEEKDSEAIKRVLSRLADNINKSGDDYEDYEEEDEEEMDKNSFPCHLNQGRRLDYVLQVRLSVATYYKIYPMHKVVAHSSDNNFRLAWSTASFVIVFRSETGFFNILRQDIRFPSNVFFYLEWKWKAPLFGLFSEFILDVLNALSKKMLLKNGSLFLIVKNYQDKDE